LKAALASYTVQPRSKASETQEILDMPKEEIIAIIAAGASLVLAVWSLATAGMSRAIALRAEEKAKRGELVRVNALEVIHTFLVALTGLFLEISTLRWLEVHGVNLTPGSPEFLEHMKNLGNSRETLARLQFTSDLYWTRDVNKKLIDILAVTENIDMQNLEVIEKRIREIAESVSEIGRTKYLS
jgi:hypothetical protein